MSIPITTEARIDALEAALDRAWRVRDWEMVRDLQDDIRALQDSIQK